MAQHKGYKQTPEHIKNRVASRKKNNKVWHSKEACENIKKGLVGKFSGEDNPMFGRVGELHPRFGCIREKHPMWKGDKAGYAAMHYRVKRVRGAPKKCEICGKEGGNEKYHWANLTGNFSNTNDYKRMCVSCHRKYDLSKREQIEFKEG